ncbi:hypothetical protein GCM10007981_15400 [Thermocladium modestius]|uniref:C2H2-type domain-containing protein n=1 Tax=Thermocladium modestius TaxID=62609 RepID=A0A830GVY8_9CREN|nr:hypothetical protein [Thermocladium modestius]GGP21863.1 hypothetical protein GCM10007981_15400 [Thermocladium modestius]
MIKCPSCGKTYSSVSSLVKHIRLKGKYDAVHEMIWNEFKAFETSLDDDSFTETDAFREFLMRKGLYKMRKWEFASST